MEQREANVNISVGDIIFIYNNLVERLAIIKIDDYPEDPLTSILTDLGNRIIEIKRAEKELISPDLLELKMNLEIRYRLLIKNS